jgi:hypothetical protein
MASVTTADAMNELTLLPFLTAFKRLFRPVI